MRWNSQPRHKHKNNYKGQCVNKNDTIGRKNRRNEQLLQKNLQMCKSFCKFACFYAVGYAIALMERCSIKAIRASAPPQHNLIGCVGDPKHQKKQKKK